MDSRILPVITGVVGLALGLLLALVFSDNNPGAAPAIGGLEAQPEPATSRSGTADNRKPEATPHRRPASTPHESTPAAATSSQIAKAPVQALIETLKADTSDLERPVGELELRGKVLDDKGKGIAGVTVYGLVTPEPGNPDYSNYKPRQLDAPPSWLNDPYADAEALEERLRKELQGKAGAIARTLQAVTDEEGVFILTGLPDERIRLTAHKTGYTFSTSNSYARPGEAPELTGNPVVLVTLNITLPGGEPPAGAAISMRSPSNNRGYDGGWYGSQPYYAESYYPDGSYPGSSRGNSWNPEERTIQMTPGTYTISASYTVDKVNYIGEVEYVTLEAGKGPYEFSIELKGRPTVRGVIHLPFESDAHIIVRHAKIESGEEVTAETLVSRGQQSRSASGSGLKRRFQDISLEPGRYLIGAGWTHSKVDVTTEVVVEDKAVDIEMTMPEPDRNGSVEVTVLTPDGRPALKPSFTIRGSSPNRTFTSGVAGIRLESGAYLVDYAKAVSEQRETTDMVYTLIVRHRDYGEKSVEFRPGTSTLRVTFDEPGRLRVSVSGVESLGSGQSINVSLYPATSDNKRDYNTRKYLQISENNTGLLEGIAPGEYLAVISTTASYGTHWSQMELAELTVSVRSGEQDVNLSVPQLYEVTINLPVGQEKVGVQLYKMQESGRNYGSSNARAVSDSTGRAVFKNIPPGKYGIWRDGNNRGGQKTIDVPTETSVHLE